MCHGAAESESGGVLFYHNAIAEVAELLLDSSFASDINVHSGPFEL